jgi:chemotaxis protein CheC
MDRSFQFTEETKDIFLEISNIGIGRAARSLSELAGRYVTISVPNIDYVESVASLYLNEMDSDVTVQVCQRFYGDLNGEAIVVLGKKGATRLTMLMGDDIMEDAFGENEQGAILELGNIMIGGLIGSISNSLNLNIHYDIPQIELKGGQELASDIIADRPMMVIVKATLTIDSEDITSYLVLVFPVNDFATLINKLASLL